MADTTLAPAAGTDDQYSLNDLMGRTRVIFDGSGLPMDDLPLEGEPEAGTAAPVSGAPAPTAQEPAPLRYANQGEAERALAEAAERERLFAGRQAALEQQLATMQQQLQQMQAPAPSAGTVPGSSPTSAAVDAIQERVFEQIEGLDASAENYTRERARLYVDGQRQILQQLMAEQELQSVLDARVQAQTQQYFVQHDQQQQVMSERESIIAASIQMGKERGYDIREPGDMQSPDSILYWAYAQQVPNEGTAVQQITRALGYMPPRQGTPTSQPQTRPQPLARSGAPAAVTTPAAEEEPFSINSILREQRESRRIGSAA